MASVRLSVIIVTYNSRATLWPCLRSLWPQVGADDEVIIVDNASSDGTLDDLDAAFPGVRLIRNPRNVGYASGNNVALREARGECVLLLNPDVVLEPNALQVALTYLAQHPDVGILGPKVLLPNGRLDPPARRTFKTPATYLYKLTGLSWLFPRHPQFGRYYLSYLDDDCITDVDAVVGAFLLARRDVVDEIGLLDERFFMYCEDEDWCWRARLAGWRIVYHPGVLAYHRKGSSARKVRFRMIFHWHRSIFIFHRKNIAPRYPVIVNVPVYGGMLASLLLTLGITGVRQLVPRRTEPLIPPTVPDAQSLGRSPSRSV
jgi:GT2 family glycosyltransferase